MQILCQRFVKTWLAAAILGLVVLAGLNVLVDPAGAYPRAHLKAFDSVRYLGLNRVTKAEMARRGDWEIIILGSSRAELGFPAAHPFLTTNKACNLSLAAARFPELVAAFDFACAHNPLKHVLLGLDLYMFSQGERWVDTFPESRFNPDVAVFPYYCKQLIGRAATDRTWETIRRKLQGYRPIPQETRGFHNHTLGPGDSQHEMFDRVMRFEGRGYQGQSVDPSYLELFRHVVRVCRDQHIDLQVAIMPVHALDLELVYEGGRWPELEKWKQDLVEVLADEGTEGKFNLWDFTGYSWPTTEAVPSAGDRTNRMKFYFEGSHLTPALGGMVLDEMLANSSPHQFGVKLTRANVREHLARILEDRAAYARTNASDIQWVQGIMAGTPKQP